MVDICINAMGGNKSQAQSRDSGLERIWNRECCQRRLTVERFDRFWRDGQKVGLDNVSGDVSRRLEVVSFVMF